ncbi:hypothetical protein HDU87_001290 [Geranomyces variabilis]|uniref:Uncharacterized protein n=1 Tax=Geranomyces variabilis TaxID=109894 RepID=A0AAD5XRY7_9FUNG|nr:hypothetical protein HDU87_001290 [Geranomyces variabilis]
MSITDHNLTISMDTFRPLPKDILEMSESDTACQYCGVSYLLLSKYEQMVGHVRGLEAHLAGLQEYAKERPAILARIASLETLHHSSESTADSLRAELQESQKATERALDELAEFKLRHDEKARLLEAAERRNYEETDAKRQRINALVRQLGDIRADLLDQRREVNDVKASIRHTYSVVVRDALPRIQQRLQADLAETFQNQLAVARHEAENKRRGEVGVLEKDLALVRDQLREAQERYERLAHELKIAKMDAEEHVNAQKNYAQGIRSTCLKLDDQLHASKTLVSNLSHERDKLASRCQTLEARLSEERQQQSQARQDIETALKTLEGKLALRERELAEAHERHTQERRNSEDGSTAIATANRALAKKDEQLHALERSIREMHATTQSMRIDRQKTIEAHQSRIKQLQDKFVENLAIAGRLEADKREQELRRAFAVDKDEALAFLRETLTMEKDAATDRISRQLEALQQAKDETATQSARALRTAEETWSKKHAIATTQVQKLQASNAADFAHYQARIRALEGQLAEAASNPASGTATDVPTDLKVLAELKSGLKKRDAEIEFLKDMVRVECEERMGLVAELALLKRGGGVPSATGKPPSGPSPQVEYRPSSSPARKTSTLSMRLLPAAREAGAVSPTAGPRQPVEPGERSFQALMKAAAAKKGKMLATRSSADLRTAGGGMQTTRSSTSRSSWSLGTGRTK